MAPAGAAGWQIESQNRPPDTKLYPVVMVYGNRGRYSLVVDKGTVKAPVIFNQEFPALMPDLRMPARYHYR